MIKNNSLKEVKLCECGLSLQRDINAALNIKTLGMQCLARPVAIA